MDLIAALLLVGLCVLPVPASSGEATGSDTPVVRERITFILGEDKKQTNRFYEIAEQYYRHDSKDRTDHIITSVHSLIEVRDYLENNPPVNGQPWGLVNIVVHSNEWAGMSTSILPGGQRVTAQTLQASLEQGEFNPLPDSLMDGISEIHIQGCALGKDTPLLRLLSRAFGGEDQQRPSVRSSKLYTYLQADKTQSSGYIQCLGDSWFIFIKPGTRPTYEDLAAKFRARNARVKLNWNEALTRKNPRFLGDSFSQEMHIPIRWTAVYPEQAPLPNLETFHHKIAWLKQEKELNQHLKKIGLSLDEFVWQITLKSYQTADGKDLPAVVARGKSRVISVVRARMEPDSLNPKALVPIKPTWDNVQYYGVGK